MSEVPVCPIWSTTASIEKIKTGDGETVDSPRAGGKYFISRRAKIALKNRDVRLKARLTTWLIEQRRLGVQCPRITNEILREVEQRRLLSVQERAHRLLRYLGKLERHVGEGFGSRKSKEDEQFLNMLAFSESTVSTPEKGAQRKEIEFFIEYMENQDWITSSNANGREFHHLTVEGYAHLEEREHTFSFSSKAFVAMWFDDSMKAARETGIVSAITEAGYEAIVIDQQEYVGKIDDEIIAEIRRARFVVADFTHGDSGPRGGVYYEAGFAHGLDIPVMFTCQESSLEKVHFDTRQYNHIVWKTPEDLRSKLVKRIAAVIGDGPYKNRNER